MTVASNHSNKFLQNKIDAYSLKPKFNIILYSAIVILGYIGFRLFMYVFSNSDTSYPFLSGTYFLVLFILIMPYKALKYRLTTFSIEQDKLSYIRDFLGYYRNDIKYENIKEVVISQRMIQKLFGLGDVYLISNIAGGNAGITFFNLENPHQVYEIIQEKIAQHQK
jgi:uncharacterized membrane protein YdbT with pleckstrin-like domain